MAKSEQDSLTPRENAAIIPPLFKAEEQEQITARHVVMLQLLITASIAGLVYGWKSSPQGAIAVLIGGGVSILNGVLLAWRMSRARKQTIHDAHQQLRLMYFYAAERFMAVVVLLGLALVMHKDSPLLIIGGFVLGQATLLAARSLLKIRTESGSENVQ